MENSCITVSYYITCSVNEYNNNAWLAETAADDFSRLRSVQQSMNKPAVLWTIALRYPAILHKFAFLARLLTVSFVADPFLKTCVKCNLDYSDPLIISLMYASKHSHNVNSFGNASNLYLLKRKPN